MEMTLNELNLFIEQYTERIKNENYMNDLRTARVCCIVANVNRSKGKPFTEKDFMPQQKKKAMTPEQLAVMLKGITLALGGEVIG